MDVFERIEDKLEELGASYTVDTESGYFLAETWTDSAGEDVPIEYDFEPSLNAADILEYLTELDEGFNIDDYAEPYIAMRGQHGIPTSIETIMASAEEAGGFYAAVRRAVEEAVNG